MDRSPAARAFAARLLCASLLASAGALLPACKGSPPTDSPDSGPPAATDGSTPATDGPGPVADGPTPADGKNHEWSLEEPIQIVGWAGNAMEPKVFADEQLLFFNNKTPDDTQMDIHFATKVTATQYQYQGPLSGVNVPGALDGVPAIDAGGSFYFITLRSYANDFVTVYGGTFDLAGGGSVTGVAEAGQNISLPEAGKLIMDVDVSPDGQLLVLSRAVFTGGAVPASSDLDLAQKSAGVFVGVPQAATLLAHVNTAQYLEYAGTLSADGLELYFTRALDLASETGLRVMVAKRATTADEFGPPAEIAGVSGALTEGPALSTDGKNLYYHKKVDGVFGIYRVSR